MQNLYSAILIYFNNQNKVDYDKVSLIVKHDVKKRSQEIASYMVRALK